MITFMTGHRRIPAKIISRLFTSCLKTASDRTKFDYCGERRKLYFFSTVWSDDKDNETKEVFQNSHLGGNDQN